MSRNYKIKHSVEAGDFSSEEILTDKSLGGCDSIFYGSVIYTDNGDIGVHLFSLDGRTKKEMAPTEMFKVWVMLGRILNNRTDLDIVKRDVAGLPFNIIFNKEQKEKEK